MDRLIDLVTRVVSLALAMVLLAGGAAAVKVYPYPMDPSDHPDYSRYFVKHPTRSTFGNTVQFSTLRSFAIDDTSTVVDYTDALKLYCLDPQTSVGTVVWPMYPLLFTTNFNNVVDAIKNSDLYVTDIWGFVPGSGPGNGSLWRENIPQQYYPPPAALDYIQSSLGDKWLGMDIGEQDGRYIGGYSSQMTPSSSCRQRQYINFRDYSRGMEDILGPKLVALISLTFPHYMVRSGLYTMVGAEAAQALPNSQVFYAFIRGAGKQYGVLWFGNVSVYNRFGYKMYPAAFKHRTGTTPHIPVQTKPDIQYECSSQNDGGPTCGTSLNLMKRLMFAHIMYGSAYVSFENGWFLGSTSTLSPIGGIQYGAKQFIEREGPQGVHVATMALFLDFFTGLCPPRHLYTSNLYRSWGNLPYSEGDYLADNVLRIVYPQYQDSSYFHDETGFSSPTPFGDSLDVLLSDAPSWLMAQYDTVIVASNITTTSLEVKDKLEDFVLNNKGNLIITSGNLAQFPGGLLGVSTKLVCEALGPGETVYLPNGITVKEINGMKVCDLSFPSNSSVIAQLGDVTPLAIQLAFGTGGSVTVLATPFGLSSSLVNVPKDEIDVTFDTPYPLLEHVQWVINNLLTDAALFTSPSNLSIVPAYLENDVFSVLVTNPELKEQPLVLRSPQGTVTINREVALDQSEKGQVGYLPDGFSGTDIGNSTDTTIAGGDTRLFVVSLSPNNNIRLLPKSNPKPMPIGVALHLHQVKYSIRHEVLLRPTFFQHYDSIVVDYSYVSGTDSALLLSESNWLKQQNVSVYVDGSSSIDLFPHLRLVNNSAIAFNASIQSFTNLMVKMVALGSHDLILSLHRIPENYITYFETLSSFNDTLWLLFNQALTLGINVHIRDTAKNPLGTLALSGWLQACNLSGIKIGLNTGILYNEGFNPDIQSLVVTQAAGFVFISAPSYDMFGQLYSETSPLAGADILTQGQIMTIISKICLLRGYCPYSSDSVKYPFVLDGDYTSLDDEYLDVKILEYTLLGANLK